MKTSLRIAVSIAILMAAGQVFAKARDAAAKSARHANADAAKGKRANAKKALSGKVNNKTDARQTRQERSIEEVKPLRHRYSFNADASDSAGNADLSLQGGASVSGGKLVLPGGAYNAGHAAATGAALDEIAATINGAKGVTFEAWVKLDPVDWSRLFCIGSDGQNNMELVPRHDVNGVAQHPMARLNCPDATGASIFSAFGQMPEDTWCYLAAVYDDTRNIMSIHVARLDGGVVVTTRKYTRNFMAHVKDLTPIFADLAINQFRIGSTFVDTSKWDLKGDIDEFRIWATALTDEQIKANVAAGPDVVGTEVGKVSIDVAKAAYPPYYKKFNGKSWVKTDTSAADEMTNSGKYGANTYTTWIADGRDDFRSLGPEYLGNAPHEAGNPNGFFYKTNGVVKVNYDLNWAKLRKRIHEAGLINCVRYTRFPYYRSGDYLYPRDPMHGPSAHLGIPADGSRQQFAEDLALLAAQNAEYDELLYGVFRPAIWSHMSEVEHMYGDPDLPWDSTKRPKLSVENKMDNTRLCVNDVYTHFTKRLHELEPDIRVSGIQQNASVAEMQAMNQVKTCGVIGGAAHGVMTKAWIEKEIATGEVYPLDYLSLNCYQAYNIPDTYILNARFALKNLIHELFPSHPEKFDRFNRTYYELSDYSFAKLAQVPRAVRDMYNHTDKGANGALLENLWQIACMPEIAHVTSFADYTGDMDRRSRFTMAYNLLPEAGVKVETEIGVDGLAAYDEHKGFYALLINRNDCPVNAPVEVKNLGFSQAFFWVLEYSPSNPSKEAEWIRLNRVEWNGSDTWTIPFGANDVVFMAVNDNPFLPSGQHYADGTPEGMFPLILQSGIQRAQFAASDAYISRVNKMEPSEWSGNLAPPEPGSCAYFEPRRGRMLLGLRDPGAIACASVTLRHVPASDYRLRLKVSGTGLPETLPASTTFRVRVDFLNGNTVMKSIERREADGSNTVGFDSIEWFPATLLEWRNADILKTRGIGLDIGKWQPAGWDVADGGKRRVRVSVLVSGLAEAASIMVDFDDSLPTRSGYDVWATQWGYSNIGSELEDFDNDGYNNLYEYVFNGDPTNGLYAGAHRDEQHGDQ